MKLLLTSNGLSNESIKQAFLDLVGKPGNDIKVAFIPTAAMVDGGDKDWLIDYMYRIRQAVGYVDIVDLAQLEKEEWLPRVEAADVIFVGGGNSFYLSYCMEKSGFFAELPNLLKTKAYAGISAGSMVVGTTLRVTSQALQQGDRLEDEQYNLLGPDGRSLAKTANIVPFAFRPHFNSRFFFNTNEEYMKKIANDISTSLYVLDDDSALKVVDGNVEVISEGEWRLFEK